MYRVKYLRNSNFSPCFPFLPLPCQLFDPRHGQCPPRFSASKIYKLHFEHIQAPIFSPWIWKSKCTPRIKSFFWLLANDHLNTKDMLLRKNFTLNDNGLCRLCDAGLVETRDHLFWNCNFSRQCWQSVNIMINDSLDLPQMITAARDNFGKPFFFEAFAVACWNIWKVRQCSTFYSSLDLFF
jgi:hypothetical protein